MRVKTEARRQAIVAMAAQVFCEYGYEGASMAQIALRCGGSKATLYGYFPSKEELFFEVVRAAAEDQGEVNVPDLLQASSNLEEALHALGDHILKVISSPAVSAMIRTVVAESGRSRLGQIFYEKGMQYAWLHVKEYLHAAIRRGELTEADPHRMALQLKALYEAEVRDRLLFGIMDGLDEATRHELVSSAVATFLRAYRPSHAL